MFDSFFDASDFIEEHPEMDLFIEQVDEFVPVLTDEDFDAYRARKDAPGGVDPRYPGWDMYDLPNVLMFLSWTAQLKSMNAQSNQDSFRYEKLALEYAKVVEAICGL